MKVRRRASRLDPSTHDGVSRGLIPDPRKGVRARENGHVPKMRGVHRPAADRPPLFNHNGYLIFTMLNAEGAT